MLIMKPCPGIRVQKIYIPSGARRIPALVLSPEELSARRRECCGSTAAGTFPA